MGRIVVALLTIVSSSACYTTPGLHVGPAPAGVSVESHLTYYDVTAATLAEINRAISLEGPRSEGRRWGAVTQWRLTWTYQSASVGSFCEARRVKVRVRTTVTFPRWNPTAEPDSALLTWWQQYNAGLMEHERGHAMLAVQGAGDFAQALEGLHVACRQLATEASALFQRHLLRLNAKQAEYDLTTRHGRTQIQAVRRLAEP